MDREMTDVDKEMLEKLFEVNILEDFPEDVQKSIQKCRERHMELSDIFVQAIEKIPHFVQVFERNIDHTCLDAILKNDRVDGLDLRKKAMMSKIVDDVFSTSCKAAMEKSSLFFAPPDETTTTTTIAKHKKKKPSKKKRGKRGRGSKKQNEEDVTSTSSAYKIPSFIKVDVPDEWLLEEYGENKHFLDRAKDKLGEIALDLLDVMELDFYKSHDTIFEVFAKMFSKLASPLQTSKESMDKMKALLEMVTLTTEPKRDYSSYGREKHQCVLERTRLLRKGLEAGIFIVGNSRGQQPIKEKGEECDYNFDEDKECTWNCDCHGPCPCCCSGCYPLNHKDLIEQNGGVEVKIVKTGVELSPSKCEDGKDENLKNNESNEQPKIEEIFDDDEKEPKIEEIFDDDVQPKKVCENGCSNTAVENDDLEDESSGLKPFNVQLKEVDKQILEKFTHSDNCSHCCCHCGSENSRRHELPDEEDYEKFALTFKQELQRFSSNNSQFVFDMSFAIGGAEGVLLKQKTIEVCMPLLMKLMKELKVNYQLFVVQLIFKMVMSMTVARKYCFSDPEYFSALARFLGVIDQCKNREPNQLRGDAAHVLHVSLMGSGRENFVKVSKTDAFENLIKFLDVTPNNEKDAQSGEDVFSCLNLFTDEWDLFIDKFKATPMQQLMERWRIYAIEYTEYLPNFIWLIESLRKRLICIYQAYRFHLTDYRLPATFEPERLSEHARIGCSNCYQINYIELSGKKYKKCSKCHLAYYCNKECQLAHWKRHKVYCRQPAWAIKEDEIEKIRKVKTSKEIHRKRASEVEANEFLQQAV